MNRKFWGVVALGLILAASYTATFAHEELASATPAPGEIVTTAPSQITLVFSDTVENVTILLVSGEVTYAVNIDNTMPAASYVGNIDGELEAGLYQVIWTAVSTDDHTLSGSYQFEYDPPAPSPLLLVGVGGVIAVILMSAGFFLWQRPR